MEFKEILASLPDLTTEQLSVVISTATQLSVVLQRGGRGTQTKSGKPKQTKSATAAKQQTKAKGPAKLVSKFEGEPEYQAFKSAEKALRVFLKDKKMHLKDANSNPQTQDHPVLQTFRAAQAAWFVCKTGSNLPPSETSVGKEEKKASAD